MMLVSTARPIARATTKTAGAALVASLSQEGGPAFFSSSFERLDSQPDTVPIVVRAPPPQGLKVKTHCGAMRTITQAADQPTLVRRMPAEARDSHSRSRSSRTPLERPANIARAA